MSSTTHIPSEGLPPPKTHVGAWAWLRSRLFSSPLNILITVLLAWFLLMSVPALVEWAFIKANFTAANAQECRASVGGACWAFIIEKHRLILFGTYPYDEQWRPLIATIILVAVIVCSGIRRFWNWKLAIIWTVGLTAVAILMWGGVLGLTYVENARWGGLPLTLILSTFGIAFAFPIGVLLALGRRSKMPAIKALCVVYIELIRGVPLISLLFMSSVMLPLFLPEGFSIDKLLRALTAAVAGIAAISLAVAGILVMNVMLVAVTQRTGEIGLLKALGAQGRSIRNAFLAEAAMLSLFGALTGYLLGQLGAFVLRQLFPVFPAYPPDWAVIAALGTALGTGLIFGIMPARRAARLDPVQALMKH